MRGADGKFEAASKDEIFEFEEMNRRKKNSKNNPSQHENMFGSGSRKSVNRRKRGSYYDEISGLNEKGAPIRLDEEEGLGGSGIEFNQFSGGAKQHGNGDHHLQGSHGVNASDFVGEGAHGDDVNMLDNEDEICKKCQSARPPGAYQDHMNIEWVSCDKCN